MFLFGVNCVDVVVVDVYVLFTSMGCVLDVAGDMVPDSQGF